MRRQSTGFLEPRRQGRTRAVGGRKRFTVGGGPDPGSDTGSRDRRHAHQQFPGRSRWREPVQARVPPCDRGRPEPARGAAVRAGCRADRLEYGPVLQPAADCQARAAHAARDADSGEGAGRARAGAIHVGRGEQSAQQHCRARAGERGDGAGYERAPGVGRHGAALASHAAAAAARPEAPVAQLRNRTTTPTGASLFGAPVGFADVRRALAAGLGLVSLGGACGPSAPPLVWHDEAGYRWRELSVPRGGRAGFADLAPSRTGIRFTNTITLDSALWNRHLAQGGGVALGDVDGDGRPDIYLTSNQGSNALYRNLGDWRFEDITTSAGVAMTGRHSTGAVFADVDGDGDLDLLVSTLGAGVALFINDGHGVFTERTVQAGLGAPSGSMTMTLTDVDGDGHLDLYVANYKTRSAMDIYPPQERSFNQVIREVGPHRFEVVPKFREDYRVVDRPEYNLVSMQQRADPDAFYLNDGTGRFTLVPWTSGRFRDEAGKPLVAAPEYFGLSAKFTDIDGDGAPDLYVCDDFEDPDMFWLNDGTGTFRAVPRLAVRNTSNSSMAVDFSDVDRDGNVDILVVDMLGRGPRRKTQVPTHTPLPKLVGQIDDRPQWQRNTLLWNRGDGTFAQIADYAGIEASDWSWDALFLDVDLDGYEDVLATTGHLWDVMDADTWERIRATFTGLEWRRELALFPKLATKNVAFRNNGDLTFSDAGAKWGFAGEDAISHGMATADLDGDGALDVVVNRLDGPAAVFQNLASAPRVAVRLRGRAPNTSGAGSKIRVLGGPVPVQQKEVVLGGTYLSGSDPLYTFSAGTAQDLTIEVDWRRGGHTVIHGVKPNREYEITEPPNSSVLRSESLRVAPARAPSPEPPAPWFRDVSAQLGHRHIETPFNDWARQPLLPQALSQLGPGVSWYDVDGDGAEDLLIGSGRGGTLAYYRNDHGRLVRVDLHLPPARYDETTVLPLPDGKGGSMLLVGQSNYESQTPAEAAELPGVLAVAPSGGGGGGRRA